MLNKDGDSSRNVTEDLPVQLTVNKIPRIAIEKNKLRLDEPEISNGKVYYKITND